VEKKEVVVLISGVEVLAFQTGRGYTENGQRIGAVRVNKSIVFYDFDRMIEGVVINCAFSKVDIMEVYDSSTYLLPYFNEMAAVKFLQDNETIILNELKE